MDHMVSRARRRVGPHDHCVRRRNADVVVLRRLGGHVDEPCRAVRVTDRPRRRARRRRRDVSRRMDRADPTRRRSVGRRGRNEIPRSRHTTRIRCRSIDDRVVRRRLVGRCMGLRVDRRSAVVDDTHRFVRRERTSDVRRRLSRSSGTTGYVPAGRYGGRSRSPSRRLSIDDGSGRDRTSCRRLSRTRRSGVS